MLNLLPPESSRNLLVATILLLIVAVLFMAFDPADDAPVPTTLVWDPPVQGPTGDITLPDAGNTDFVWNKDKNAIEPILALNPVNSLMFYDGDDRVGAMSWEGGTVVFHGNIDDSARIFLEYLNQMGMSFCKE